MQVTVQNKPRPKLCNLPADILEKAGVVMILDRGSVFYVNMLLQCDKEPCVMSRDTLGAAVYQRNGRIVFKYDKEIWEEHGFTMDDVIWTIKHEFGHPLLEHFSRRKGRHPKRWNICADFADNCIIGKPPSHLPILWPSDPHFGLPENLSAEEYDKLLPKGNEDEDEDGEGFIVVTGKGGKKGKFKAGKHDPQQEISEGAEQELEREIYRQAVDKAYKACKEKGNLPGNLEQLIEKILNKPRINWKRALRSIIGTAAKVGARLSWKRESKRYGSTSKGKLKKRTLSVVYVRDTSGSVPDEAIACFNTELQGIQRSYRGCVVTVIDCDHMVQQVIKLPSFGKVPMKVKGRGGTSFKPPFEYLAKKKIKPDVLIYMTDLEGDFPNEKPSYPVVWATITDHDVPWGWKIQLPVADMKED